MKFRNVAIAGLVVWHFASGAAFALTREEQQCKKADKAATDVCTRLINRTSSPTDKAVYLNNRAFGWKEAGECDLAIADFSQAIDLWPIKSFDDLFYRNLHIRLGGVWGEECKGDPAKSIPIYDAVIRGYPQTVSGFHDRALSRHELRDLDGAISDLNNSLRNSDDPSEKAKILNSRALVWRDAGDLDRALSDFDEAVRIEKGNAQYIINRGELWRLKGNLDRALADINRGIEIERKRGEKSSLGYVLRGDVYRFKGDVQNALTDYKAALQSVADYIPALTGLGLTYEKMGDLAQARTRFVEATRSQSGLRFGGISKNALSTATARLAALDSGAAQPVIPAVPAVNPNSSIPTPVIAPQQARPQPATSGGRRVALVIGNSEYTSVSPLANPRNDAQAIAQSLRNIGFEKVTLVNDATREKLIDALRNFANDSEASDWAMVYYAGHGIEVGGVNYLIPVDAKLAVDRDIEYEAVAVTQVLRAADSARKIKLVMLDACRDNPFKPRKTDAPAAIAASESTAGRAIATRSTKGRGLAEVKVSGATLVVFAAKDGQVALDGEGGNSPFAVAVVQRIATPGVEINKVFRLVRDDVMEATAGRQEPYTYGSLPGKEDFYFVAR